MPFLHRKLDVFQLAVDWVIRVEGVTRRLPRDWWWLADQLRRASGSIALNTAEGSARPGTATERKYYNTARDSAAECDACVVILHRAGLVDDSFLAEAESTLNRISAMLRSLIARSQERSRRKGR